MSPEKKLSEEDQARIDELLEMFSRGECLTCHAAIERAVQEGRCMYAVPCGHRIGQGRADAYNAHLSEQRAA